MNKKLKEYWLDRLVGELPLISLPGKKLTSKVNANNYNKLTTSVSKVTTKELQKFY